jgi:biopolymer transport protein ExbD
MALMGNAGRGRRRGGRTRQAAFTEINITPLTDVVLVLLIIFMVTAQFIARSDQGMDIKLPSASHVDDLNSLGAIRVSVNKEGVTAIDGRPVASETLSDELKRVAQSPQQMIVVEVDADSPNKYLVAVMDAALGAGMPNVVLATAADNAAAVAPPPAPAPATPPAVGDAPFQSAPAKP